MPGEWSTFADPGGAFSIDYPSEWYMEVSPAPDPGASNYSVVIFSTFQLGLIDHGVGDLGGSAKIDLMVYRDDMSACTIEDATEAMLGGLAGWRKENDNLEAADGISIMYMAERSGLCFQVIGYFGVERQHVDAFEQMIESFEFTS